MKRNIFQILSFVILLAVVGQLVVSSTSYLFSDENTEETSESGMEDETDEEIDTHKKICSFDWFAINEVEINLEEVSQSDLIFLVRNYSLIERSIPVPPPEKMV